MSVCECCEESMKLGSVAALSTIVSHACKYEYVQENTLLKSEILKVLKRNQTLLKCDNLIAELEKQENAVETSSVQAVASILPTPAPPLRAPEQDEKVAIGDHTLIDNAL